jgi:S-adenosylmethionine-diacylgycerolhomoserine-N-methlytransferase
MAVEPTAAANLDAEHAERMDGMYRYQRHIYDLTRKYYLFGRDRMIARLDVPRDGTLLEVGCGTGRNLLLAHRLHPTARLYGLDISAEMLTSARANFRGIPVMPQLQVADATSFDAAAFGVAGFDRIMISYALSMIPDWEKAIGASLAALKPGGSLHIVDFGQQERFPGWFRAALQAWLGRFHVTPRARLFDAVESVAMVQGATARVQSLYRGYAWEAVIAR